MLICTTLAGGEFRADLTGDGVPERVVWQPFAQTSEGTYYRLVVYDGRGGVLWSAPLTKNPSSPYFIASLDYGVAMPEVLDDIDGDGRYEMLIPELQSDVSPTRYHRLRWIGGSFVSIGDAYLVYEPGTHNDRVYWSTSARRPRFWASSLRILPDGSMRATITGRDPHSGNLVSGEGLIRLAINGGAVYDWIRPLPPMGPVSGPAGGSYGASYPQNPPYSPGASSAPGSYYGGSAYGGVGGGSYYGGGGFRYITRLSGRDHYNSYGTPLRGIRSILHQDRANYYRGWRDPEDQGDPRFHRASARAQIDRFRIVPVGMSLPQLRRIILGGSPLVEVRVSGMTAYVSVLQP
ncbi:hypothetical protein [Nitratifractor sp.]